MRQRLAADEIHVWTAWLDGSGVAEDFLDAEEHRRAARLTRPRIRSDFIQSRTILRCVLANYLECAPAALRFTVGPHGKPDLDGAGDLRFNLSHSGDCLVIAVRRHQPIGIDVERQRPLPAAGAIARRFFTAAEADQIDRLPVTRQADGFRALWSLKEAVVKAAGEAMAYHMDRIEGAVEAGGQARFVTWHGMGAALQVWSTFAFSAGPGHSGVLATKLPARAPQVLAWGGIRSPSDTIPGTLSSGCANQGHRVLMLTTR